MRFLIFILVTQVVFVGLLHWSMHQRVAQPGTGRVIAVSLIVVPVGMVFAKLGAQASLSPALYYGLPALATLAVPPLAFGMRRGEWLRYAAAAFSASPAIHLVFSLGLGWHEYLPFWHVPSLADWARGAA